MRTQAGGARRISGPSEIACRLSVACGSARRQRVPERLAHMRSMQARIVALLRPARGDLQVGKYRPRLGEHGADLLLEHLEVGKVVDDAIPRRAGKVGEVHPVAAWNRVPAIGLIGAVL